MDSLWRTIWAIGLLLYLSDSILSGAAKGMFDILLVLPWLLCVRTTLDAGSHHPPGKPAAAPRRRKPRYLLVGMVSAVILIGGFRYFTHSRASRYGIAGNEKGYPSGTTGWSQELYGVKIPESAEFMVYMVARYWTHGYYGLAGCLELPFEWSHGVGHSVIWMKYAASLTNDPECFWKTCYPARLEAATGYSTAHYWHTIYPWIASDLTFPGAIVFVGLMGYLLAQAWSETLRGENPFALGFLTQVMLLFYYVPANNCRLMYAEEAITFWGLLAAWRMTRR
jgi:hypothetical protein